VTTLAGSAQHSGPAHFRPFEDRSTGGGSSSSSGGWINITTNYTASIGDYLTVNTSSQIVVVSLPRATGSRGEIDMLDSAACERAYLSGEIKVPNPQGSWDGNHVVVSATVNGNNTGAILKATGPLVRFVDVGGTTGWRMTFCQPLRHAGGGILYPR
jgi:hypothetical protein